MISDPAQLGWRPFFQEQLQEEEGDRYYPGRIARIHRGHCIVWSAAGEVDLEITVLGEANQVGVGDWLLLPREAGGTIRPLRRHSQLIRQAPGGRAESQTIAANIDTLFIVTSCDQEFNPSRLERYLALAAEAGIRPAIVLTKIDLNPEAATLARLARTLQPNLALEEVNAHDPEDVARLKHYCGPGQTVAFLGSSGVGKSTLINRLAAATQKTAAVRAEDSKGRHTTTARSLHLLKEGGILIDTPGIRELQLTTCGQGIAAIFPEIAALIAQCHFNNCAHQGEPGCAVLPALASGALESRRWRNFLKLRSEQGDYQRTVSAKRDRPSPEKKKRVQAKEESRPRRFDPEDEEYR